jgi:hypothetical protein
MTNSDEEFRKTALEHIANLLNFCKFCTNRAHTFDSYKKALEFMNEYRVVDSLGNLEVFWKN